MSVERRAIAVIAAALALALFACRVPPQAPPKRAEPASSPAPAAAAAPAHEAFAVRLAATLLPLAERTDGDAPGAVGTVTGLAHWDGTNPLKIKQLTNTSDVPTCGERVNAGTVVAGAGGELANVVVELRRSSDPPHGPATPLAKDGDVVRVSIDRCLQEPHVLIVPLGASVEIENRDGILHELASLSVRNAPFVASLPRYRRKARVAAADLSRPERVRVACQQHPWAISWWVITGTPRHALTGRDGRFVIENVPVGTWKLTAWHEELGEIERTIDVSSAAPSVVDLAWR